MKLILEKAEAAKLELTKKGLPNPPLLRVVEAIDVSGSMKPLFNADTRDFDNSEVQSACDQLQGAGLRLDDNGEIDVYAFHTRAIKIGTAASEDFGYFVRNKMMRHEAQFWGGTEYSGVITLVESEMFPNIGTREAASGGFFNRLFGAAKKATAKPLDPVLAFLMTDGENTDKVQAENALRSAAQYPIFWNLCGIGDERFPWLQQMGSKFPNVDFLKIPQLRLDDETMYKTLFTDKFVAWAKQFPPGSKP